MVRTIVNYYLGPPSERERIKFGGLPAGTLDIYPERLDVFRKSIGVRIVFGAIGSAIEGKGKPEITIPRDMITSVEKKNDKKGRLQECILMLADGRCFSFSMPGRYKENVVNALLIFLDTPASSYSAPAGGSAVSAPFARDSFEDVSSILDQAQVYDQRKDYQGELAFLLEAEKKYPSSSLIQTRIGRTYRYLGSYARSLDAYNKALRLNPREPVTYNNIATLYVSQNQYEMALPFMEKALRLITEDPSLATREMRAIIYSGYALCAGKCGNLSTARQYIAASEQEGCSRESIDFIRKTLGI